MQRGEPTNEKKNETICNIQSKLLKQHLNRDVRKPISYCWNTRYQEGTWYTRDSIIKSYTTSHQLTFVPGVVNILPPWWILWKGRPNIMSYSELEDFQEKFLMNRTKHLKKTKQCNITKRISRERKRRWIRRSKNSNLEPKRSSMLSLTKQDWSPQSKHYLFLLSSGTARHCDGKVQGKRWRLKKMRDCMRNVGLPRMERRLASYLATPICSIPGNLARAILNNYINKRDGSGQSLDVRLSE